jgi:non-specific serine/threonine protein kinase
LCRRLGDRWGEAAALNALSWLHVARERFDESGPLFEETLAGARSVGDEHFIAIAEVNLAEYFLASDDAVRATDLLASCARRHQSLHFLYSVGYMLDAVARLALQQGDAARAALLLGAATHLRESIGVSVWGTQLERRNQLIAAVRATLGEDEFPSTFATGAALSYSEAVDAAAG